MPDNKNRVYQVIKGTFGAFSQGDRFSEATLRDAIIPPAPRGNEKVDLDAFYGAIINRGLSLSVIMPMPEGTGESARPVGPGTVPGAYSASIDEATKAVVAQRQASSAAVAAPVPATTAPVEARPAVQHGGMAPAAHPASAAPQAPVAPAPAKK